MCTHGCVGACTHGWADVTRMLVCHSGPVSPAAAPSAFALTRLCGPLGGSTEHLASGPLWSWLTVVAATLHLGLTQAQLAGISEDLEPCH